MTTRLVTMVFTDLSHLNHKMDRYWQEFYLPITIVTSPFVFRSLSSSIMEVVVLILLFLVFHDLRKISSAVY